ncbi:MAG: D-alanine--D-alanine ligase, partial [Gemmatimonadota bacterium]
MRIAVLMGGTSVEREVSLASGRAVLEALRERGHEAYAVDTARGYIPRDEEQRLLGQAVGREPPDESALEEAGRGELSLGVADVPVVEEADVAFLALHGGHGEDGRIQAVLDVAGVPYTGSGHLGSAVAMDKRLSKELLERGGVPTPAWSEPGAGPGEIAGEVELPAVVKPAGGGST